eukprot:6211871-Pleurochrysis_carterae.AAC.1
MAALASFKLQRLALHRPRTLIASQAYCRIWNQRLDSSRSDLTSIFSKCRGDGWEGPTSFILGGLQKLIPNRSSMRTCI